MASLSTVYSIATILSSVAGMGAAFLGNKIYPLVGGSTPPPPTPAEVKEATRVAADKADKLAAAELFEIKEAEKAKDAFETTAPPPTPEPLPEPPAEVPEPEESSKPKGGKNRKRR